MANDHFDKSFLLISLSVFEKMEGKLPFDVYVQRAEGAYTRIFPEGEVIDTYRLDSYRSVKGVESLNVRKEDYRKYLLYVEKVAVKILSKDQSTDDCIATS